MAPIVATVPTGITTELATGEDDVGSVLRSTAPVVEGQLVCTVVGDADALGIVITRVHGPPGLMSGPAELDGVGERLGDAPVEGLGVTEADDEGNDEGDVEGDAPTESDG